MLSCHKNNKRLPIIILGISAVLLFSLTISWLRNGRTAATTGRSYYLIGDCQTALPLYEKVTGYPSFAGPFVDRAAQEANECRALEAARNTEDQAPQSAIAAYENFITNFQNSPLETPALAAIHRLYLDWATAETQNGRYLQAVDILEKAAADYPALEAETEERLLQTYLDWAMTLETSQDYDQAIIVYNELQARYPQFTTQAQSGIDKATEQTGQ